MTSVRTSPQRATEGVIVVVAASPGVESTVEEFVSAVEDAGEHCRVVVVADDDHVVREGVRLASVDTDHRRVFLVGSDGLSADRLVTLLGLAREERADVVVGCLRALLLRDLGGMLWAVACLVLLRTRSRDIAGGKLVDRCALAEVDLTGQAGAASAELLAKLRGRGARVVRHPVGSTGSPTPSAEDPIGVLSGPAVVQAPIAAAPVIGAGGRPGSAVDVVRVWADLVRRGPLGGAARRLLSPQDPLFAGVLVAAVVLSVSTCAVVAAHQLTLAYIDAVSHLLITRRVIDASTPGAAQLGGVWLPLSHLLTLPLALNDSSYHSGIAGSVVSMFSYVATAGWLYRIAHELTGRRVGGLTAAVVFCANPNVLYLQSTPMTEALLLACLAAATWHLLRWCRDDDYKQLAVTGIAVLAACLVRYEGWVFLAAVGVVVGVRSWQRSRPERRPWLRLHADLVFFSCLATSGVAGWLIWNAAIFGDPLDFVRGDFAKPSLWVSAGEPAVGDWGVALMTYLHAMVHDMGLLTLLLAVTGLVGYVWRTGLRGEAIAPLPLLVFLPFFVVALHSGQRPLHVPEISGDLYNLRFALVMVLPVAVFTAYLVTLTERAWARLAPAALVLLACGHLALTGTSTLKEAQAFRAGGAERVNAQASTWLREHYDHGRVLMQSWSNETVSFDSRVPMDQIVYEGSFRQWEPALADPVAEGIRWIHMRHTPGGEDQVWRRLNDSPVLNTGYTRVYADDHHAFYLRLEQGERR